MYENIKENFLQGVNSYELDVLLDTECYKHFSIRESLSCRVIYTLTLWPEHLCITSSEGTYLFKRLPDMLNFFRSSNLCINPNYWSEKIIAESAGASRGKVWDRECFLSMLKEEIESQLFHKSAEEIDKFYKGTVQYLDVCEGLYEDSYLDVLQSGDYSASGLDFDGFWEVDCTKFRDSFIWSCYAIVWGIQQYDKLKNS